MAGREITPSGAPAEVRPDRQPAQRIFLLSPALCGGPRSLLLRHPEASFPLARQLRSRSGAALGDVFSFLSGLYFRGKLAYARAYARPATGVVVITPADGLRAPEHPIRLGDLERYGDVRVAVDEPRYRQPLLRDARKIAKLLDRNAEVVLLGSVATGKYLDILADIFGPRLYYPRDFSGRGDMSRGALLLRCVREGRELDYARLERTARGAIVR